MNGSLSRKLVSGCVLTPIGCVRNVGRKDSAEKKMMETAYESVYNELREAAEVHRQVRQDAQSFIKPGMSMIEIVQ